MEVMTHSRELYADNFTKFDDNHVKLGNLVLPSGWLKQSGHENKANLVYSRSSLLEESLPNLVSVIDSNGDVKPFKGNRRDLTNLIDKTSRIYAMNDIIRNSQCSLDHYNEIKEIQTALDKSNKLIDNLDLRLSVYPNPLDKENPYRVELHGFSRNPYDKDVKFNFQYLNGWDINSLHQLPEKLNGYVNGLLAGKNDIIVSKVNQTFTNVSEILKDSDKNLVKAKNNSDKLFNLDSHDLAVIDASKEHIKGTKIYLESMLKEFPVPLQDKAKEEEFSFKNPFGKENFKDMIDRFKQFRTVSHGNENSM